MTRTYNQVPPSGISTSGPTYEPQVTPWNRDDDTSGVTERKPGDDYDDEDRTHRKIARDPETVRQEDEKIWNDRGLKPAYTEDIGGKDGRKKS